MDNNDELNNNNEQVDEQFSQEEVSSNTEENLNTNNSEESSVGQEEFNEEPEYDNTYDTFINEDQNLYSQKHQNKFATKKALATTMIICILFSSLLGFGGGVIATRVMEGSSPIKIKTSENNNSTANGSQPTTPVSSVVDACADSVVEITTEVVTTNNLMRQYISQGAGSGVIISEDGYIVTNNHVIGESSKVTVTLRNGQSYEAQIKGSDSKLDIAILKIDAHDLKPVTFADSNSLTVGQMAVAIGNPLGQLGGTVTDGIISALNRDITIDGETHNLLQTNAAINPGNSGGGLFNANGELIGLVVAKSSGSDVEGLGFAIPSNDVKFVVDELSQYGYVRGRADLGMSLIDIDSLQMALMYKVPQTGVYVSKVNNDSNAQKAGFQIGDCILSVNSKEVTTSSDVESIIDSSSVGDKVTFSVIRDKKTISVDMTLGEYVPENINK